MVASTAAEDAPVAAFSSLMAPFQPVEDSRAEKLKAAATLGQEFMDCLRENRIWFDEETCLALDVFDKELKQAWVSFTMRPDRAEGWLAAWETIEKQVPFARQQIEKQMRKLLGAAD